MFPIRLFVRALQVVCVSALPFASFLAMARAQPNSTITMDAVVKRIQGREARVQSARFAWTEERFDAKGSWARPMVPGGKNDNPQVTPSTDLTYETKRVFSFDGEKTRTLASGNTPDFSGDFVQTEHLATFDGEFSRALDSPNLQRDFFSGRIYARDQANNELHDLVLEPLFQCYRMFHSERGLLNAQDLAIETADAIINDTPCIVVAEIGSATRATRRMYWLDPARDFVIQRFTLQKADGPIQRQTDFSYKQDSQNEWVPSAWKIQKYATDGTLALSITATVTEYDLNPKFPPTHFTIDFPANAFVDDLRDDTMYIERADGSRRQITRADNNATYEQLRDSEPKDALDRQPGHRSYWLIAMNVAAILILVLYVAWRNRTARTRGRRRDDS